MYLLFQITIESYDNYTENFKIEELKEVNDDIRNENKNNTDLLDYFVTESYKVKKAKESKKIKFEEEESFQITQKDKILIYKQKSEELEKENKNKTGTIIDDMSTPERWLYLIQKK